MPMYTTRCGQCGRRQTIFRHVSTRDAELPVCHGAAMQRVIEAPAVHADLPGYQSPIDGKWVEGRRARTEDLKRSNCRPWEGMETERKEAVKRAEEADRKFETQIERGIAETFNNMSAEKQRALETL
jgi:hypothetical protein